jgi:hypothetical protein
MTASAIGRADSQNLSKFNPFMPFVRLRVASGRGPGSVMTRQAGRLLGCVRAFLQEH